MTLNQRLRLVQRYIPRQLPQTPADCSTAVQDILTWGKVPCVPDNEISLAQLIIEFGSRKLYVADITLLNALKRRFVTQSAFELTQAIKQQVKASDESKRIESSSAQMVPQA